MLKLKSVNNMIEKNPCKLLISSFIFFFIMSLTILSGCILETEDSNTPSVSINGEIKYISIQQAINQSKKNSTIVVYPGVYKENILINKSINLFGTNAKKTIIIGKTNDEPVITITSQGYCKISKLSIRNNLMKAPGIEIRSDNNNISENIVSNCTFGIYANDASYNSVYDNLLFENTDFGVFFNYDANHNIVNNNIFLNNTCGLRVRHSRYNYITNNEFENNIKGMFFCCGATANKAYYNNFQNNTDYNGNDDADGNTWYNKNTMKGNYWDDYTGTDSDGDGVGENPYILSSDESIKDLYPLMNPKNL